MDHQPQCARPGLGEPRFPLKIVKKALAAEGLKYKVAGISQNATIGPFRTSTRQRHVAPVGHSNPAGRASS